MVLYPEKPTWVTIIVGNTIFGALLGERKVDWGLVMRDVVQRLLSRVKNLSFPPSEVGNPHMPIRMLPIPESGGYETGRDQDLLDWRGHDEAQC